jgi:hypothetical protein
VQVVAQVPIGPQPPDPGDPVYSLFGIGEQTDWMTNPSVAVSYGGVAVVKTGGVVDAGTLAVVGTHGVDATLLQQKTFNAGRGVVAIV